METLEEWEDRKAQEEADRVNQGPGITTPTRWISPLQTTYNERGQIVNTIRHYGGARHDELDWDALNRHPKGAPLGQDVLVYVAAGRDVKPGEYNLASRSATARRDVARAAGTGLVLRVFVPETMVLEPVPIKAGEPPTEEVLIPEGVTLRVYEAEPWEDADTLDAELIQSDVTSSPKLMPTAP